MFRVRNILPMLLAVLLLCSLSLGATLVVKSGGGGDHTTIQAAIDAAGQDDVIEVQDNAAYTENLAFPNDVNGLTLQTGVGNTPTITLSGTPAGDEYKYIDITAPGTTIQGFTINFSGAVPTDPNRYLIFAEGGASTVRDCNIVGPGGTNSAWGIVNIATLENVEVSDCNYGMVCNVNDVIVPGFSYSISGCHFYDNRDCAVGFADGNIVMDDCLLETSGYANVLTNGYAGTLDVLITNSTIRGAVAGRNVHLLSPGTVTIEDSIIMDATHVIWGDEILQKKGTLNLNRCIIKAPSAGGAGVVSYSWDAPLIPEPPGPAITNIDHCNIKGSSNQWTVYTMDVDAVLTITNSIVTGSFHGLFAGSGTISSNYNDVFCTGINYDTSVTPGANDISANPLYVQTDDPNTIDYFRIYSNSPAATADDSGSYMGSQGILSTGDLNLDLTTNFVDMAMVAVNWRDDNVTVDACETTIEDFESYSTTASLAGTWDPSPFSGELKWVEFVQDWWLYPDPSRTSIALITDPCLAHSGSKALVWDYNTVVDTNDRQGISEVMFELASPIDLSQYDQMRIWVWLDPNNEPLADKYVWIYNECNIDVLCRAAFNIQGNVDEPNSVWHEWRFDLSSEMGFVFGSASSLEDLTDVVAFGFGTRNTVGTFGSTGTIRLDDISLIKNDKCPSYMTGDIDQNCRVDVDDLVFITEDWLRTVEY